MCGLDMNSVRKRHLFYGKNTQEVSLAPTAPTQTQFALGLHSDKNPLQMFFLLALRTKADTVK